jgi:glyoxylase-like metal-dependent hydrolase (beta-lactamase superfamily II)
VRKYGPPLKVCDRVWQVGGQQISEPNDCCVYLVDGGGPLALVDSGCGPGFKTIVSNIIRAGFEPEDIETLLLTHCHVDHIGAAGLFRDDYGVSIVAHHGDAPAIEAGDRLMTAAFMYGVRLDPLPLDRVLTEDGETIDLGDLSLRVLETPGHTPGSVSAYVDVSETRVLFGQDVHGPFHPDFGSDIGAWRGSMARLLALDADILCEGHFGIYSPSDAVRAYIEGYLQRF